MLLIVYLVCSTAFFARLGKESKLSPFCWGALAVLFYFAGEHFAGFFAGGMIAHAVLFLIASAIWVATPRKSTAERMQDARKS
jgi:hypothetical protein